MGPDCQPNNQRTPNPPRARLPHRSRPSVKTKPRTSAGPRVLDVHRTSHTRVSGQATVREGTALLMIGALSAACQSHRLANVIHRVRLDCIATRTREARRPPKARPDHHISEIGPAPERLSRKLTGSQDWIFSSSLRMPSCIRASRPARSPAAPILRPWPVR
jgi:hypothetical protein